MKRSNTTLTSGRNLRSTFGLSLLIGVGTVSFSLPASAADITPEFLAAHPWCYPATGVLFRATFGPTSVKTEKFSRDGQQKISLTPFENGWSIEKAQANWQMLKIYSRPPDIRFVKLAENGKDITLCTEYGGKTYSGVMLPCAANTDTISVKVPVSTEMPDKQCK